MSAESQHRRHAERIAEEIAALRAQLEGGPAENDATTVALIEPPVKRIGH